MPRMIPILLPLLCAMLAGCGDDDGAPTFGNEIRTEQVVAGEFTFDVRIAGANGGEPVLLLHGFPESSYQWRAQLPALAEAGYRAIAPDQRGYSPGARPSEVSDYQITFLMQDALAIADEYGIETFHLVGHDWGAGVAWGVAALAPQRVLSLTILSIPHPDAFGEDLADVTSCQYQASSYFDLFTSDGAADLFLRNEAAFLRNLYVGFPEDAVAEYVSLFSDPTTMQGALNWYRANVGARDIPLPSTGPIRVPTQFIWSDGDFAVCRDTAEKTARFIEAPYDFVVLEGVDHWIAERVPEEVNELLLAHLAAN